MGLSAVFALCARSTERYLPAVLANLDRLSACYERRAFVLVENDSTDQTKNLLRRWISTRDDAVLIELDGLDERLPRRTERLAACRNAYVEFVAASPYAGYDHLVVLDADNVNAGPIDVARFVRARDWLNDQGAAAVFANARAAYYDIWALRHPTWCPDDFLAEVRRERERLGKDQAMQRFCYDRQVQIPETDPPIEVDSAFGGLGLYRLADTLAARYVGLSGDGHETCEHVAFNLDIARRGGRFYILPWFMVGGARRG
jgi:hypothetical protein